MFQDEKITRHLADELLSVANGVSKDDEQSTKLTLHLDYVNNQMGIIMKKKYDADKTSIYEQLKAGLEAEQFRYPECRIAELSFLRAKLYSLVGNFETASDVWLQDTHGNSAKERQKQEFADAVRAGPGDDLPVRGSHAGDGPCRRHRTTRALDLLH